MLKQNTTRRHSADVSLTRFVSARPRGYRRAVTEPAHRAEYAGLRDPCQERVLRLLEASGPRLLYTYRQLARHAYGLAADAEPSAAQLAAVRRCVVRLVADGRAERYGRRAHGEGEVGIGAATPGGAVPNPAGERLRRPRGRDELLEELRAARQEVYDARLEAHKLRREAES